VMCSSTESSHI